MKRLRLILLLGISLLVLASLASPGVAWAQDGDPPPDDGGDDGDGDSIITHIFKLIFPIETMQAATEILLVNILQRNAEGIKMLFSGMVADLSLQNPGLKTPSPSLMWLGTDVFSATWGFMVKIAIALWPATLAIMIALAAQESAISTSWGITDLKQALGQWLGGVLACALSLEILDLANRLSNAIILGIIELPIAGAVGFSLETVVNATVSAILRTIFFESIPPAMAIIIMLVLLALGLTLIISIIAQYAARVALLYILVALAPVVLVIGILYPARWLQWLWVKGVLLVMLLGPITALLLKLALAAFNAIHNPILGFLVVFGVISVLLAINGAIIKGVFGAAIEMIDKSVATAQGIMQGAVTTGLAVGAAVLTGGAALGVVPAAVGGAGGAAAAGGAASTAAAGAGTSAGGGGAAAAGLASGAAAGGAATGAAGETAQAAAASTSMGPVGAPPGASTGESAATGGGGEGSADGAASAGSDEPAGFLDRLRQRWAGAAPHERMQAAGSGLRAAGGILGPRSLAGRTAGAVGAGLQFGANQQEEMGARPSSAGSPAQPSGANLAALGPDEIQGYQEAMRDIRRDLRTPMEAAGLDLRQVERDAMAPVWAAAQHDTLSNVARQSGFGDRGSTAGAVGDLVAYRVEGQLMTQGFLSERITRPGAPPSVPLSDNPALLDYDRGQQLL